VRDKEASKARLLEAATAEFAGHGIAGARVDRIAENARVNKSQLYAYYGNKERLFDTVFELHLDDIANRVPMDGRDLPGYVVRLYDFYLDRPMVVRLATWARLERMPTGWLGNAALASAMVASIEEAQNDGALTVRFSAEEIYQLAIGISMTWSPASVTTAAARIEPAEVHARRRKVLYDTARLAFAPEGPARDDDGR
jgi:AcrR family transcriptional regulator